MCYILWYKAFYITCCVQAGLLDQPQMENQLCYVTGYIPQYIARAILSALQHMVMLYSMSIYHAIQQIRLYSSHHIQHLAIQHIFYAIQQMHIPCYIAGKAIYLPSQMAFCYIAHILCYIAHAYSRCYLAQQAIQLPSYIASCYIAHILCYIAHAYTMLYSLIGYIPSLIYSMILASCYIVHILCYIAHAYSRCYIAPGYMAHRSAIQQCLQQGQSYIAPVQAIQHDPRFQMALLEIGPSASKASARLSELRAAAVGN